MRNLFRFLRVRDRWRAFRLDLLTLWHAVLDRRTPWLARAVMVAAALYVLSPIDILPDFLPFVGWVDDAVILPALFGLALGLLPMALREEFRARAMRA
jgi:uncharacterized membrane protein YkvA (DUF1232 family)